jgi:hypothetical protein
VHVVGNVSDLNHLGHDLRIPACAQHAINLFDREGTQRIPGQDGAYPPLVSTAGKVVVAVSYSDVGKGCAPPRWPVGQLSSKRETAAGLLYGGPQLTVEARKG